MSGCSAGVLNSSSRETGRIAFLRGGVAGLLSVLLAAVLLGGLALFAFSPTALAADYVVTSTDDTPASGTLRWAITLANGTPAADTITFNITGTGVQRITLASALPAITYPVTIDATTQPGWSAGNPAVEIDGFSTGPSASGLVLESGATGSAVRGLAIMRFTGTQTGGGTGIVVRADSCVIDGCHLGLDAAGAVNGNVMGIYTQGTDTVIGGTSPAQRNIVSGNSGTGIAIAGVDQYGTSGTIVRGNYIGIGKNGILDRGNGGSGIELRAWSHDTTIGGTEGGAGNLISGNEFAGIAMMSSNLCAIQGNIIGLGLDGDTVVSNRVGLTAAGACAGTTIGGTTSQARNIISGNNFDGINCTSGGVLIQGNYVGTDATGKLDRGNASNGIALSSGSSGTGYVGGTAPGAGNLISGNGGFGITLSFAEDQEVRGNIIGMDLDGEDPLENMGGIRVADSSHNTIGGAEAGARNVISGNSGAGVWIDNGSSDIAVMGNYIGVGTDGVTPAGNGGTGVQIDYSSQYNTIGGTESGAGNVISCNEGDGVSITSPFAASEMGTINNTLQGNLIGLDEGGTLDRGNAGSGVSINRVTGANGGTNTVGGAAPGAGNIISWNRRGVFITNSADQVVQGNRIGTGGNGADDCGNDEDGVLIEGCPSTWGTNTVGGSGAGEGNVISGNATGVRVVDSPSQTVAGNRIGTSADGTGDVGNDGEGVICASSNGVTIGNNVISGNGTEGVSITGASACSVHDNIIGLDSTGDAVIADGANGIYLHDSTGANSVSGNTISGNGANGVYADSPDQVIEGNRIGTNVAGDSSRGNALDGVYVTGGSGTVIGGVAAGSGNVVSGNGASGIHLIASDGPALLGNTVGLSADGSAALLNAACGLWLEDCNNSTIGGSTAGYGNVISGNGESGVRLDGGERHSLHGNYVGTDAGGALDLGNAADGINITDVSGTKIGGAGAGEGNVVSGNGSSGVAIAGSAGCSVRGNVIGLDSAGTAALGNGADGLHLEVNMATNTIGGTAAAARNVISANGGNGLALHGCTAQLVQGNYIGMDAGGTQDHGNRLDGIHLFEASNNTIGGPAAGARNVVSGNDRCGIHAESSMVNTIQGNFIGTDCTGSTDVGNAMEGVLLSNSNNTIIGGTGTGAANVISGNDTYGVRVTGSIGCLMRGNLVGPDSSGAFAVGNSQTGVLLEGNRGSNTVGGTVSAARNVISGNAGDGIMVHGSTEQLVAGNYVGLLGDGDTAMPNGRCGISLYSNSSPNTVGGASAGAGNVISANGLNGVSVESSRGQLVQGNYIGTGPGGAGDRGNAASGVYVHLGSDNTIGGTTAAGRNVISGNDGSGIHIEASTGNVVQGNYIGKDSSSGALPNAGCGVYLCDGAHGTTVGGSDSAANLIAHNLTDGVGVRGSVGCEVSHNQVIGNARVGVVIWDKSARRDVVSRNVIYENGALGIDLLGDGVTPNDGNNNNPEKPNRGYNFPVITGAFLGSGGDTRFTGTAPPGGTVELYSAGTPDPSGHGQAMVYLGSVTAESAGEFVATFSGMSLGEQVTATATSPAGDPSGEGNTSEFSANRQVVETPSAPTVSTQSADGLSSTGATLHGTLMDDGGLEADRRGFRYREKGTAGWTDLPDTGTPPFSEGTYALDLSGLDPKTGYEFYARAHNSEGWGEGAILELTTLADPPAVVTSDADGITSSGATLHGDITGNGGEDAAWRGFRYREKGTAGWTDLPDTGAPPFPEGTYALNLTGLERNTTFEFRARANNSAGWGEGAVLEFTTVAELPEVVTSGADGVTASGATLHGNITGSGGTDAAERGFRYRKKGSTGWTDLPDTGAPPFGEGAYQLNLSGLDPNTRYEFYARAHNSAGWGEGAVLEFATLVDMPEVATSGAYRITSSGATLRGSISGTGGENADERGFRYREAGGPAWVVSTEKGSFGAGAFSHPLSGLTPGTVYEYQALARNSAGAAYGGTVKFTTAKPLSTWYLAEGSCAWGFETYITIENPEDRAVVARLTYVDPSGESGAGAVRREVTLPPLSQTTVNPRWDVGDFDFATKVECPGGGRIAVDRTMTWTGKGAGSPEAHNTIGVTGPATTWYMPEGSSKHGFETWTCLYNPNGTAANVKLTYMTEESGPREVRSSIRPRARATHSMLADVGEADSSIRVDSDVPVIAERSTYRNARREGSCSIGAVAPTGDCFLAEGTTAWGFTTYVLVQNPNDSETRVTMTYMTPEGPVRQDPFTMPASSRRTIRVNDVLPPTDFSTRLHADKPVVAERAMYWDSDSGEACHDSIGLGSPRMRFMLPDGQASDGRETWTLVQNPNPGAVRVRVRYLFEGGGTVVRFDDEIPGNSRRSYNMADKGVGGRASVLVESLDGARPIVVERAMYWNDRGAGTNTVGYGE